LPSSPFLISPPGAFLNFLLGASCRLGFPLSQPSPFCFPGFTTLRFLDSARRQFCRAVAPVPTGTLLQPLVSSVPRSPLALEPRPAFQFLLLTWRSFLTWVFFFFLISSWEGSTFQGSYFRMSFGRLLFLPCVPLLFFLRD